MGEIAAETRTMMKKKKKKGRPSLLDLQKRSLKEQQRQQQLLQPKQNPNFNQNPNSLNPPNVCSSPRRRSTRGNHNSYAPEWIGGEDDDDDEEEVKEEEREGGEHDDDDDERKEKKHKLLHGLNPLGLNIYGSESNAVAGDDQEPDLKRCRITGSIDMGGKVSKATDTLHESSADPGPTTPLPDKKLLVFILDRLQKKDTYGVFSEPVDPEELPDYHDIIENPMDFSTVRKKLDGEAYANLEQFEKDIFLICSNAMQYNSPDTIYFRQARTIQELAKKDFENLREDSDDSEPHSQPQPQPPPKVVRRGRPPKLKKSMENSPSEHVGPEVSSSATLASGGDNNSSTGYNLRKTTPYKSQPDPFLRAYHGSHSNETYAAWLSEWENEFPASVVKAVLKYGKKPFAIDENRRDTYRHSLPSTSEPSVLATFEGELKQLIVVGLNSEHGYARSLTRFAAELGPVVWKIASKKIERVLPAGVEFGPGWVGENKEIERQRHLFPDKQKISFDNASNSHLNRLQPVNTIGTSSFVASRDSAWTREDKKVEAGLGSQTEFHAVNNSAAGTQSLSSHPDGQKAIIHNSNGVTGGYGYNRSSQMGTGMLRPQSWESSMEHTEVPSQMFGVSPNNITNFGSVGENDFSSKQALGSSGLLQSGNSSGPSSTADLQAVPNGVVRGKSSWQGLPQYHQPELVAFPPDLNVGFLTPSSPNSSVPIGSPQQPDLALQL